MVKIRPRDLARDDTNPKPPEDPNGYWICRPCTFQAAHDFGAVHSLDRRLECVLGDEQGCATVAWRWHLLSPAPLKVERAAVNPWNDAWIDLALLGPNRQVLPPDLDLCPLSWSPLPAGVYTLQASSHLWRASTLRLHLHTTTTLDLSAP